MKNHAQKQEHNHVAPVAVITRILQGVEQFIVKLDKASLWWIGLLLCAAAFLPIAILKEGSVFEIHDQLDETLLTYVLNAKYLGTATEIFPELLNGVNASGMQPSAVAFILLYRLFPVFTAFVLQAMIVVLSGYFGMYFSVKELTDSSILAVIIAGIYCMLPVQPVYGLSLLGVPLLLYAFLCLYHRKHLLLSFGLILFFGLTTHLVLIGYVVLSFWALAIVVLIVKKSCHCWIYGGFGCLTGIYILVNYRLFYELFLGNGGYVSHREELINYASPVWSTIQTVFLEGAQHAPSCHRYLLVPIGVLLVLIGLRSKKLSKEVKSLYYMAIGIIGAILLIAVFYGISKSATVVHWKNSVSGFLHYFQMERYYWLYPTLWYLEIALLLAVLWKESIWWFPHIGKLLMIAAIIYPTFQLVKGESMVYQNINQINNGTEVTEYVTWESFYAEDLMQQLDEAIGRDKETYRIAHLGISPAPALMHGFYTIDGYSNNYPLEYKHQFRKIIEKELAKNEAVRLYFDEWGSRCYVFSAQSGAFWMLAKGADFQYKDLELDLEQMRMLGCEYLFAGAQITNAQELGLNFIGYYETENSYWGIWLYQL